MDYQPERINTLDTYKRLMAYLFNKLKNNYYMIKKTALRISVIFVSILIFGSMANISEAKAFPKKVVTVHKKTLIVKAKKAAKKIKKVKTKAISKTKILNAPLLDPNNPPGGR